MSKYSRQRRGGADTGKAPHVAEVEGLIVQLPGVMFAQVAVNDWGAIQEIHVLATTERGAKQIVRDVESALAARWGVAVDHKKISVAQVATGSSRLPPVRLKLLGLKTEVDTLRGRLAVEVTLGMPGQPDLTFTGRGEGPGSLAMQPTVVANAVINALNSAVEPNHHFILENASLKQMTGHEIALALITYVGANGGEQLLVGGAQAGGDPLSATVRACLQATNRLMAGIAQRSLRRVLVSQAKEASAREARAERAAAEAVSRGAAEVAAASEVTGAPAADGPENESTDAHGS